MKRADLSNGTHKGRKKNGTAPGQSSGTTGSVATPLPDCLAPPVPGVDATPIDAPNWPQASALWLQPDGAPSITFWSGLAVERQNRIPMPDFQPIGTALFHLAGGRHDSPDALRPAIRPVMPQSDLTPLGWDPRVVCRKEGVE